MKSTTIGIATHKYNITSNDNGFLPINVGATLKNYHNAVQLDNIGDNISHKNFSFAELTATYWIWKNSESEIKGLFHYRRFLDFRNDTSSKNIFIKANDSNISNILSGLMATKENISNFLEDNLLIVPYIEHLNEWSNYTIKQHYDSIHIGHHLELAMNIIENKNNKYYQIARQSINDNKGYFNNMLISKKDIFDEYCTFLFGILFEVESNLNLYDINIGTQTPNARWAGFLGERLTNIFIRQKIFEGFSIKELPIANIEYDIDKNDNYCDLMTDTKYSNKLYNKQNPDISVIIAAYNVEGYISTCISSVIHQTLSNIEIIVVNDGSSDNTLNIINDFANKDCRIKVINQRNKGLGFSRNTGLEASHGKYVHFMDGDDFIDRNFLYELYMSAEKNLSEIVISSHIVFSDELNIEVYRKGLPYTLYGSALNINNCQDLMLVPNHVWDKLFKKTFIEKIKFPIIGGEDAYFWFNALLKANRISIVHACLYFYRLRDTSLQSNKKYMLEVFYTLKDVSKIFSNRPIIIQQYYQIYKLILINHMAHRLKKLLIKDNKFYKQFYSHCFEIIESNRSKLTEKMYDKLAYYGFNKNYYNKFYEISNFKQFKNVLNCYNYNDIFMYIIKNLYLCVFDRNNRYHYKMNIKRVISNNDMPIKYSFNNNSIVTFDKFNNGYKLLVLNIPIAKLFTYEFYKEIHLFGFKIFKSSKILLNNIFDIKKSVNDVKKCIDKIYNELHLLASKQNIILDNHAYRRLLYSNKWEKNFIKHNFYDFDCIKYEKEILLSLNDLDLEGKKNLSLIYHRLHLLKKSNYTDIDIFSLSEQIDCSRIAREKNNIVNISKDIYSYNGYLLPINHFEDNIFFTNYIHKTIKEKFKPKTSIVDIGAFIGDTAIVLNSLKPDFILCYEANINNYNLISKTIELNQINNIIPINKALGDKNGFLYFDDNLSCTTMSTLKYENKIVVTTLDDELLYKNYDIGLIKIDIEGYEQHCLKGMIGILKKHKPILMISIYHNTSDLLYIKNIINDLNLGYKFTITPPSPGSILLETMLICYI